MAKKIEGRKAAREQLNYFQGTWYGEPVYFTLGDKWWDPCQDEVFAHSDRHVFMKEILWRHHPEYSAPKFYDKWIPKSVSKYIW